jgi:carbon-monoxide dehydrogenase small subunit
LDRVRVRHAEPWIRIAERFDCDAPLFRLIECVDGIGVHAVGNNTIARPPVYTTRVSFVLNGQPVDLEVPNQHLLLDTLRRALNLTGTKDSCGIGVCGACTVLLDGQPVSSCLTLTVAVDGRAVETIEGVAEDGRLHPVQQAFIDHGGFQCGICTPGQIMSAKALLAENPRPSEEEIKAWMMGNLCRCTGYYSILESIQAAADSRAAVPHAAREAQD